MKTKTENIVISTSDRLAIDLSEIIEKKHRDVLKVMSSSLVILFWQIGKEINQYLGKNKGPEYGKPVIRTISIQLVANYGLYFTENNLKRMGQFADQFPDFSGVARIAPFVNWEHISLLSQIKDLEAKLFYIRLTIEQGLSVNDLRKQMSANLFKPPNAFKSDKDRYAAQTQRSGRNKISAGKFLQIFQLRPEQKNCNNPPIKNVFKEPLLSFFRPLMEPSKRPAKRLIVKSKKKLGSKEELFGVLSQHFEKYKNLQNRWLNANLNLFFWEIGKRINQEILLNNKESIYQESIIGNASKQLQKKYSQNFSANQLYKMAKFAEQFTDLKIASRIAYLISWKHILTLLPLQEIEAKFFYARLTATQGLSVTGLRKQIAKKVYKQTRGAKELEQSTMAALQNPIKKISIEKKKNNTFIGTTIFVDIEDSLVVPNIFKNPYLPLLVLSQQRF